MNQPLNSEHAKGAQQAVKHRSSPHFRDRDQDQAYQNAGCHTMALLDAAQVQTLRDLFQTLLPDLPQGFASTVLMPPALRQQAHNAICDVLADPLGRVLTDFRIVLASLVARAPGSDQRDLPLHQDWSFVNETTARSISVWIPLQDVDTANGCLQVVPGSHLLDQPLLGIGAGFRYRANEPELREKYLTDLPLPAGKAAFFDHRLIHGSRGNVTAHPRLAVGAVLLARDVPLHMGLPNATQSWDFATRPDDFLLNADLDQLARTGSGSGSASGSGLASGSGSGSGSEAGSAPETDGN